MPKEGNHQDTNCDHFATLLSKSHGVWLVLEGLWFPLSCTLYSALISTFELFDGFHKGAVVCVSAFWCPALAVEGP